MAKQAASPDGSTINNMNAPSTNEGLGGSENTIIEIAKDGDLVVKVIEYGLVPSSDTTTKARGHLWKPTKSASFQVSKQV
ncbi:hypothetical protein BDBG_07085 [Blastomyces gilchristii SLH14081]|uniref:Uncharacterized protein n=1 Tax=Blastomyces gilchristii (strain SLH14081) TaxID=559298 RepID=A0A179UX17_BLAGS|nr:uncharacterized protein BDBG_07085 [Blastomyces gilchristii SLH14081]OAT11637.1 hypothetical protein BDBG_07085 [Blastomyces gilchristii SLH14081]